MEGILSTRPGSHRRRLPSWPSSRQRNSRKSSGEPSTNSAPGTSRVRLDTADRRALVHAMRGLPSRRPGDSSRQAALKDGVLDGTDVAFLHTAKADLLDSGLALEVVPSAVTLDSVGGMDRQGTRETGAPAIGFWEGSCDGCRTAPLGCSWSPPPTTWLRFQLSSCERDGSMRSSSWTSPASTSAERSSGSIRRSGTGNPVAFDLPSLAAASEGLSGAE